MPNQSVRPFPLPTVILACVAALTVLPAGDLHAQSSRGDARPGDGDWSLMFTLFEPDVVTNFGIFRMMGDRMNLGLEVDFEWADGEQDVEPDEGVPTHAEGTDYRVSIGPSLRWYGTRTGPVSPYLRSKVAYGWGASDLFINTARQHRQETTFFSASLAIGAEWYPVQQLGIAGHTGLVWTRTDEDRRRDSQGVSFDGTTRNLRTFRSGIAVNFYFR